MRRRAIAKKKSEKDMENPGNDLCNTQNMTYAK